MISTCTCLCCTYNQGGGQDFEIGGPIKFSGVWQTKILIFEGIQATIQQEGVIYYLSKTFGWGWAKILGGGDHGPPLPPSLHTTQSNYLLPWSLQLQFALSLWARFCISEKALTLAHCLRLAQSSSTSASTHKTQIVTELSIPSLQGPLGPQAQF